MEEVIKKLLEHDRRFTEHDKRFDEHDKRFDEHDKRFDEHDKRFDALDQQVDFLARKAVEHDERLERIETNMATKVDLNNISNTLDKLVGLATTKEQETVLLAHGLRRAEDKLAEHDRDIKQMKPLLGLS